MYIFRPWQKHLQSFKKIRLKQLEKLGSQDTIGDRQSEGQKGAQGKTIWLKL